MMDRLREVLARLKNLLRRNRQEEEMRAELNSMSRWIWRRTHQTRLSEALLRPPPGGSVSARSRRDETSERRFTGSRHSHGLETIGRRLTPQQRLCRGQICAGCGSGYKHSHFTFLQWRAVEGPALSGC